MSVYSPCLSKKIKYQLILELNLTNGVFDNVGKILKISACSYALINFDLVLIKITI